MKPVKISRLIKNLQEILEERGDLNLVYSIDDEGNAFNYVYWDPTVGYYIDGEFLTEDQDNGVGMENVVCIN